MSQPVRINRQWRLAAHPQGMVKVSDFALHEVAVPEPTDGQFLIRVRYLSFDPAMRGWISGRDTYVSGIQIGDLMRAMAVGEVVESKHDGFPVGCNAVGFFGWQEYCLSDGGSPTSPRRLPDGAPPTMALSILGITGLTAYFGMLEIGQPKTGENVLVSGAAGATGSVAAQITQHVIGAPTVGIAGGPEKCAWLTETAGLRAAIDYKNDDVGARVRELFPNGIDVFFDNVGGEILDAALANLAQNGRIVLCGGISRYNDTSAVPGPANYLNLVIKRGRMEGFIVLDYIERFREASEALLGWVREGKVAYLEDVQTGFENAPETFLRLFDGRNRGKQLLAI